MNRYAMKLKSYFADTVEDALRMAQNEMGADAMLLNSKRSGPEARHLGAYEVVCATEGDIRPAAAVAKPARNQPVAPPPIDKLSSEVSELRQQMERLARTLARSSSAGMSEISSNPELSRAFTRLTESELDADLAFEVVSGLPPGAPEEALRTQLRPMIHVDSELGCPGAAARIVALVGPPGAGKTTTLVKLAVQYGIAARKPTQILTVDTYRIAAAEELKSYAAILGIGCQVLDTPANLAQALEEFRHKNLILIDTPGLSRHEMDGFAEWAGFLSTYPGIDTQLVLPASMRTNDLKRMAAQYAACSPSKLIFTRLDETETFGPILSQSVRMRMPVSFLSRGQGIPEDLIPASPDLILDLVLGTQAAPQTQFGTAAA